MVGGLPSTKCLLISFFIGTHVAGIAAGTRFGVAKKANLIAVRVIDSNGVGCTFLSQSLYLYLT